MAELKVGDTAPEFRLKADDGRDVTLQGLRGKRVVLYFFPKVLTPGCSTEAAEFRDAKPQFDELETLVFGCSADPVESQGKFKSKFKLNFTLLSNPDFTVIEAYGARRMKSFLGKSFLGIVRSTVLVGPDGRVEKLWPQARAKGHAAEVVKGITEVRG
jgi:thioredoxin-dependent peroxiredoxin